MDTIKLTLGYTGITTVLPFNGVSQLKMGYLINITSDVQSKINSCVHFTDLSFNNNLKFASNMSYVN